MSTLSTRTAQEVGRLADDVYPRLVKPQLRPEHDGLCVALDVLSGEFEVDADTVQAVRRLRARVPDAEVWVERAGQPTLGKV